MKFCTSLAFNDPEHFCDLAKSADTSGWDLLAVSDHVVHPEKIESPYPYTRNHEPRWQATAPWPDPFVAISAMAAVTNRLRFLTSIYVLPLRHPVLVAKSLGTLAVMSNYRVTLGIGVGWMQEEFDLLEQGFRNRGSRTSEMLEVMRKLWAGGMVEHHGTYYDFDRLQMSPAVNGSIPIAVGGTSDAALRRAARIGDGWISDIHSTQELRQIIGRLRGYRAEYGRENEPFDVFASANDAFDVDGYKRLEEVGVTHLQTVPWAFYPGTGGSLAGKKEALERFAEDVIAKMR